MGGSLILLSTVSGIVEALVSREREKGQGKEMDHLIKPNLDNLERGAPPAASNVPISTYHTAEEWVRKAVVCGGLS